VFRDRPQIEITKKYKVHCLPPFRPISPPRKILGKEPEIVGEDTNKVLPKPDKAFNFFIVGPNTAKDANPVPNANVHIHNATLEFPSSFLIKEAY